MSTRASIILDFPLPSLHPLQDPLSSCKKQINLAFSGPSQLQMPGFSQIILPCLLGWCEPRLAGSQAQHDLPEWYR
jgi:hypothetical protein